MGQNGAHLKFKVKQGKDSFDVVAFNKGNLLQEFQQAQGLELAVDVYKRQVVFLISLMSSS